MEKNKIVFTLPFVLLWIISLTVNVHDGAFLYPEYSFSVWQVVLSIAYLFSFCFLVYGFCESKKLLIWYSVCVGVIVITIIIAKVVSGNTNAENFAIITFPAVVLSLLFLAIPFGIPLSHIDETGYGYIIIILMFYIVYFTSRFIKKRKSFNIFCFSKASWSTW